MDYDILKSQHRFLRSEEDNEKVEGVVARYESALYKDYVIADLSRHAGLVGLRWRTEKEVKEGKGKDFCGAKSCFSRAELSSVEALFSYVEQGESKSALGKALVLRFLAEFCSEMRFVCRVCS